MAGAASSSTCRPTRPDLNPIDEALAKAFAKLKALLRKSGARSREALIEAMGRALKALTARDARSFIEHRGYPVLRPNYYDRRSMYYSGVYTLSLKVRSNGIGLQVAEDLSLG